MSNKDKRLESWRQLLQRPPVSSVATTETTRSSTDYLHEDDDIEKFFVVEAKNHLKQMQLSIAQLHSSNKWSEALLNLRAITHTLKGSASIVHDKAISRLAHLLEEKLQLDHQPSVAFISLIEEICKNMDWLIEHIELRRGEASAQSLRDERSQASMDLLTNFQEPGDAGGTSAVALERLSNLMEEADSSRAMLREDLRQMRSIGQNMLQHQQQLHSDWQQGRQKKRHKTKSRSVPETLADLHECAALMHERLEACEEGVDKLQEIGGRLWKEIARSRLIPMARLFTVLQRILDDLSTTHGLAVKFNTEGAALQIEKKIFETLFDPLLQLTRNAIAHGFETSAEREAAGKPAFATLSLQAQHHDDNLEITLSDDGRGLRRDELLEKVQARHLPKAWQKLSAEELIFISGMTTKDSADEMAGRGIGMDIVAAGLEKLNGILQVESREGHYTRFFMRFPASRFYTSAMIVRARDTFFAIPTAQVRLWEDDPFFQSKAKAVVSLPEIMGSRKRSNSKQKNSLLVGAVQHRFYLEVDEIVGEQSVVLSKLGGFFRHMPLIWGATLMREGEMAFVPNLSYLFGLRAAASVKHHAMIARSAITHTHPITTPQSPQVLVVDDAMSVRELLQRLLKRAGFVVHLASDGLEALRYLQEQSYGLIVTDLEMPGLDGYELMARIRANKIHQDTPLLVISSRVDQNQQGQLLARGAQMFLAKPFEAQQFIKTVKSLLPATALGRVEPS